jgi:hypothetical protein
MPPAARAGGWLGAGGRSRHLERNTGRVSGRIIYQQLRSQRATDSYGLKAAGGGGWWWLALLAGGESAAHDRCLFGHCEPQDVIRGLCGICRLDGCLGNERYREQLAAQP